MIVKIPENYMKAFRECPDVMAILIEVDGHHRAELTRDLHYKKQGMTLNNLIPSDGSYEHKEPIGGVEIGWRDEWLKP